MITRAAIVNDYLEARPSTTVYRITKLYNSIPAWQWAVVGGWWPELRKRCPYMLTHQEDIRGKNALHVDIGDPASRCSLMPSDGRGVTRDGGTLDWIKSGGSVLDYGVCEQSRCYWCSKQDQAGKE